ncbi:hypothetical protein ACWEPL_29880 [Nonomuraea sp. NPDC004186]
MDEPLEARFWIASPTPAAARRGAEECSSDRRPDQQLGSGEDDASSRWHV